LARFNVSNEHGEQAHMSFLGLPSPGAAAAVIGLVLMQQELRLQSSANFYYDRINSALRVLGDVAVFTLPALTLAAGLLMVSAFRYPHLVNKYLRGRRTIGRLIATLLFLVLLVTAHRYTVGLSSVLYALSAPVWYLYLRQRRSAAVPAPTV
jgi:phosphatidylserine synthase